MLKNLDVRSIYTVHWVSCYSRLNERRFPFVEIYLRWASPVGRLPLTMTSVFRIPHSGVIHIALMDRFLCTSFHKVMLEDRVLQVSKLHAAHVLSQPWLWGHTYMIHFRTLLYNCIRYKVCDGKSAGNLTEHRCQKSWVSWDCLPNPHYLSYLAFVVVLIRKNKFKSYVVMLFGSYT